MYPKTPPLLTDSEYQHLAALLKHGSNQPGISAFAARSLRALLANPHAIGSIWHPLGFLQVKLANIDAGHLKIHIWPLRIRRGQTPDWPIHRHVWPVYSTVLVGNLTHNLFAVANADPNGTNRKLYQVGRENSHSILSDTRIRISCSLAVTRTVQEGNFYNIGLMDFHSTDVPTDALAATVIFTPPPQRAAADVVGPADGAERYSFHRNEPSIEDLIISITSVLNAINDSA